MMKRAMSRVMSPVLAPVSFDMPKDLHAIAENGDVKSPPFPYLEKTWIAKGADEIRDRLLAVRDQKDVAEFLNYSGYIVMLSVGEGSTTPAYPIRPEQVSGQLMNYVMSWKHACGEILTPAYRYWPKTTAESLEGRGTVRDYARRGTGRFNEILITFRWDESGKPVLTLRPATRLEAAVLSCHLVKLAGWKFRQCASCGEVFQVAWRKEKFCSARCAHRDAVRNFRKRARKKNARKKNARRRRS
jgi:hypothetical protein